MPNELSILYLDQCVLRYVTNLKKGNPGLPLGEIINVGVKSGALICPFSDEHFWETSAISNQDKRRTQLDWLSVASCGACFKSRESLVALQLIEIVRPPTSQEPSFLCKVDVGENEKVLESMHEIWGIRKKGAEEYFSEYNKRRASGLNLRAIPNEVMHARRVDIFYHGIADCIAYKLEMRGERDALSQKYFDDRPFGSQVLDELLMTYEAKPKELEIILSKVIETRGHCAPLIQVQSRLFESWMLAQKRLTMADIYDLNRISTVLPYADILVVDDEQARHLSDAGLSLNYGAKVFTLKEESLEPLFEEIMVRINRRFAYLDSLKR
jgi:hypothetical protein